LGVSAIFYDLKGATAPVKNEFRYDYQSNVIFGVQWGYFDEWLGNDLKVKTELALHTVANDQFDGRLGPQGGIFGGGLDNYFTYDFGLLYYFDLGARSTYCDLYEGIVTVRVDTGANRPQQLVDYQRIEEIVARNSNAAVDYQRIEAMIKKYLGNVQPGQQKGQEYREVYNVSQSPNWVLLGINFDPGKATFRPEAYPILINAAQVLISNPALKVEILGYTDNVGTQEANKKLSLQRANAVLQFLASKGIDNSRLTAKGLGDADPIGDNKTNEGRGFNRRIEFKIIR
jgi:OOP family OmpA-OmpF porin